MYSHGVVWIEGSTRVGYVIGILVCGKNVDWCLQKMCAFQEASLHERCCEDKNRPAWHTVLVGGYFGGLRALFCRPSYVYVRQSWPRAREDIASACK